MRIARIKKAKYRKDAHFKDARISILNRILFFVLTSGYPKYFSASKAAMQPVPAEVIA